MSTTPDGTTTATLQSCPYIFFYGRCKEALEFYKETFGGSYELTPDEDPEKVMHAAFNAPGIHLMASDGAEIKTVDPDAGNISIALTAANRAEGERVFEALSASGTVVMPFTEASWGGYFGIANDRFGTQWLINTTPA